MCDCCRGERWITEERVEKEEKISEMLKRVIIDGTRIIRVRSFHVEYCFSVPFDFLNDRYLMRHL